MNKKWIRITAGVINILVGCPTIFMGLLFLIIALESLPGGDPEPAFFPFGVLLIIIGIMGILGGVFIFLKRKWFLGIVGGIATLLGSVPWLYIYWSDFDFSILTFLNLAIVPGIIAIIFTTKSKGQFSN